MTEEEIEQLKKKITRAMSGELNVGKVMKAEKRNHTRKIVDCVHICDLTSLSNYMVIAKSGIIFDASPVGFLLRVSRTDLVPEDLRGNLSLETLISQDVVLYLPQMNLDLDGQIIRAKHLGKGSYEIAINFGSNVPEYWRQCLIDLLPEPGEIEP